MFFFRKSFCFFISIWKWLNGTKLTQKIPWLYVLCIITIFIFEIWFSFEETSWIIFFFFSFLFACVVAFVIYFICFYFLCLVFWICVLFFLVNSHKHTYTPFSLIAVWLVRIVLPCWHRPHQNKWPNIVHCTILHCIALPRIWSVLAFGAVKTRSFYFHIHKQKIKRKWHL